ncbi:hypothetical protein ACWCWD_21720 [Streptomyces sp. NPDC001493]
MDTQKTSARPRAQAVVDRSRTRTSGLSHVTVPLTSEFVVVGNHLAQHPELSLVAIGISVHIQSLPPGRRVGIKALAERFQEGAETIARAIRELERYGYLDRPRDRVGEGRFLTRTIAYNHPDAAYQDRASRKAVAELKASERKASTRTALGRKSASVPRQRAGAPAAVPRHGTRAAHGRRGAQQRPVREMCMAADALRELWEPGMAATDAPAAEVPAEAPPPPDAVPAPPSVPAPPVVPALPAVPEAEVAAPGPEVAAPEAEVAAPEAEVTALDTPVTAPETTVAAPDASTIRASLPRPVQPSAPSAAELERHATAVALLSGLRGRDERLRLSEKDVAKLAPSVGVWLERGVEPDTLYQALLGELPVVVKYPVKFVGRRLIDLLPPPLPADRGPGHPHGRREAPRTPAVTPMQTCDGCDRAFRSPAPGRCRDCRPGGAESTDGAGSTGSTCSAGHT